MKSIIFLIGLAAVSMGWAQTTTPTVKTIQVIAATKTPFKERIKYENTPAARSQVLAELSGDGTRGGGEVVYINGRPELRDLWDMSVCRWVSGKDLYRNTPHTAVILDNIAKLDWYFAETLKQEIFALDYCLTNNELIRVPTEDPDGLTAVYMEDTFQVAIRLFDSVYIDNTIFKDMGAKSRGYLLVHEAMHSFLPWMMPRRNESLRSMVSAIAGIEEGRISTREAFHRQMIRNGLDFPTNVDRLQGLKNQVEFLLVPYNEQRAILLNELDAGQFLSDVALIPVAALAYYHRPWIQEADLSYVIDAALYFDDVEVLQKLVDSPQIAETAVAWIYLRHVPVAQPKVAKWMNLETSQEFMLETVLGRLSGRAVEIDEGRIIIEGQQMIGISSHDSADLMGMRSLGATDFYKLPVVLRAYLTTVAKKLKSNDLSLAGALTVDHANFYNAFGIKTLISELEKTDLSKEQIENASQKLQVMGVAFWKMAEDFFERSGGQKNWKKLKKKIDFNQLGYKF